MSADTQEDLSKSEHHIEDSPMTRQLNEEFSKLSLKPDNLQWLPTILRSQSPTLTMPIHKDNTTESDSDSVVIHDDKQIGDWQRVARDLQVRKAQIQPKLKQFFEPLDSLKDDSSSFNTLFKLFGKHDSFTSEKLNQIIDNIGKGLGQGVALTQDLERELNYPLIEKDQNNENHTNATTDTDHMDHDKENKEIDNTEDYIKNANDLFNKLKTTNYEIPDTFSTTSESELSISHIQTPHVKTHKPILIKPQDFSMKFDSNIKEWIPTKEFLNQSYINDITNLSNINDISFSESKKKLIDSLNLVQPNGDWETLTEISLIDLDISNLQDFDNLIPHLRKVNLSTNRITFLDGLNRNLTSIIINKNLLNNMTSFMKFRNLRYLDISDNLMENLNALSCLENLTYLKASNNDIESIDGLNQLDSLIELDLSGNSIHGTIDFKLFKFDNLIKLELSDNKIEKLLNIHYAPILKVLKLDENNLTTITSELHKNLKKISLNLNKLSFNCDLFPNLRVLRIDNNESVTNLPKLNHLIELSIKCMNLDILSLNLIKLDLSGNFNYKFNNTFKNITNLSLISMNLTELPDNFDKLFPNLLNLNLNFNKLTNLSSLKSLSLQKVNMISNNLSNLYEIMVLLTGSRNSLRSLDIRLNPINLNYYPYIFSPHELENSIQLDNIDDILNFTIHYNYLINNNEWMVRDDLFTKNLDKTIYEKRIIYKSILLNYLQNLLSLDGFIITVQDHAIANEKLK